MATYINIPAQAAADAITVSANTGLSGDGTAGSPLAGVPASASAAGYESVADFNKLATVPTGNGLCVVSYSAVIDLVAAPALYQIIAPCAFRMLRVSTFWEIKSVGGTRSVSPAYTIGTNAASYNDVYTAGAPAALLTQAAETLVAPGTSASPAATPDLTTSGLQINITAAMTGTNPVCTARLCNVWMPLPV